MGYSKRICLKRKDCSITILHKKSKKKLVRKNKCKYDYCREDGKPPSFVTKAGLGMIAGMCGAFVGTPAEVSLIRMTSDGRLPLAERRNYKSVVDALARIVKEEGVATLWRGAIPTMGRAMVVNAAQLASYSQVSSGGNLRTHVLCSLQN